MNPNIKKLYPYPFERLAGLLAGIKPDLALNRIALSLGEPKHAPPQFVLDELVRSLPEAAGIYPVALGIEPLRTACADWFGRRFGVDLDPATEVLPVGGSREGLFSIAQATIDASRKNPTVLMPNPCYQIYEGGALLAGALPYYMNTDATNDFVPDLDAVPDTVWSDCQLIYVCSPGNPTGVVLDSQFYEELIDLADRHDFLIVADECYCELYRTTPPVSLLEICKALGRETFDRCIVFHSLSKRSSLPGLRSGFVAGDGVRLREYLKYRTYHGCAMSEIIQRASVVAWNEDSHAAANRDLYNRKYDAVAPILGEVWDMDIPPAAFYLWPQASADDEDFVRDLYAATNVIALPGSYLSRKAHGSNPGAGYLRLSLVAPIADCVTAARRIRDFVKQQNQPELRKRS